MDFDAYAKQMLMYYTRRTDPAEDLDGRACAEAFERNFTKKGRGIRELAVAVQKTLKGRDVLELAAGSGQFTRFLVRSAKSLLATDASPRALAQLDGAVTHRQELRPGRFRCIELDAFHPELAPGTFNGAVAVNWFQHMPRELIDTWIGRLHSKLVPGAVVLIAINHLTPKSRARLFSKPFDPNLYEPRRTYDGQQADIVDNVFSETDLRRIFERHARKIEYTCGVGYCWIVYKLRK